MPLHMRILIGFAVGAILGVVAHIAIGADHAVVVTAAGKVAEPAGKLFLRALLMCVIPLVASSLVCGVVGLGDLRKLGRVGGKTLALTLVLSALSVCVGLAVANLVRPGDALAKETRTALVEKYGGKAKDVASKAVADDKPFSESIVNVIPDNVVAAVAKSPPDMLGLMLFFVFFGIALALLPDDKKAPVVAVFEGVFAATSSMVQIVMKVAPIGVACLMFAMTSRFGFELLPPLALYVVCVLGALAFHFVVVYGGALRIAGVSPLAFVRRGQEALLTAFSTSSSNATLPTALEVTEKKLGVPKDIGGFVLTVGATANQNGTALFEGVTVLFLAQVFGVELTLAQQVTLLVLAVVAGIGTAGVPSASLPFIAIVCATVGVPPEGLAIILGVDRFLDMCRTVLNVGGDMTAAVVIARSEGARPLSSGA